MTNPDARLVSIMLAEDNPADVTLIEEALNFQGLHFSLRTAADGECAMRIIEEAEAGSYTCDLVLLDLNLPKLSGDQLLSRIRKSDQLRSVPVVIVTSSNSPHDRAKTAALGANRYFLKSPDVMEFLKLGKVVEELWMSGNQ